MVSITCSITILESRAEAQFTAPGILLTIYYLSPNREMYMKKELYIEYDSHYRHGVLVFFNYILKVNCIPMHISL